jgi:hypothetical protein
MDVLPSNYLVPDSDVVFNNDGVFKKGSDYPFTSNGYLFKNVAYVKEIPNYEESLVLFTTVENQNFATLYDMKGKHLAGPNPLKVINTPGENGEIFTSFQFDTENFKNRKNKKRINKKIEKKCHLCGVTDNFLFDKNRELQCRKCTDKINSNEMKECLSLGKGELILCETCDKAKNNEEFSLTRENKKEKKCCDECINDMMKLVYMEQNNISYSEYKEKYENKKMNFTLK